MLACIVAASFLIGGGIATVKLVDNGAAIPWAGPDQVTEGGAKATVATYLGYLADGNATAANRMASREAEAGCDGFLSNAVFSSAKEHIAEVEITGAVKGDESNQYEVSFEYVLDGVDYAATINTEFSDADDRWVVEPATRKLEFQPEHIMGHPGTLNVSGVDVDQGPDTYCDFEAYPAVYELGPPSHGFVTAPKVNLLVSYVSNDDDDVIAVGIDGSYTATERVTAALEEKLPALIDKCFTVADLFGTGDRSFECPAPQFAYSKTNVTDLTVEALEYPTVAVEKVYSNCVLYSAVGGRMKLSYSAIDVDAEAEGVQRYSDVEADIIKYPTMYVVNFDNGKIEVEAFR